jgi:hypothetical protein
MSKPAVSLAALTANAKAKADPKSDNNVVALQRDDATTSKKATHTSLYLHPHVRKAIREIAFQYDIKPHDLYVEGIDLMLAKYGKASTSELSK